MSRIIHGARPLPLPMSDNALPFPPSGWQTARYWAEVLGEDEKTFRGKIAASDIPFAKWGAVMLVHSEHFAHFLDLQLPGRRDGCEEEG